VDKLRAGLEAEGFRYHRLPLAITGRRRFWRFRPINPDESQPAHKVKRLTADERRAHRQGRRPRRHRSPHQGSAVPAAAGPGLRSSAPARLAALTYAVKARRLSRPPRDGAPPSIPREWLPPSLRRGGRPDQDAAPTPSTIHAGSRLRCAPRRGRPYRNGRLFHARWQSARHRSL
jgi:hypothetical protein